MAIVIAARNEEKHIGACLNSIVALRYPAELLDIVVVDDRSTDRTAEVIARFTENYRHLRALRIGSATDLPPGKTNAVMCGVELSRGEIIMFTDADCTVPPDWVENIVSHYSDPSVGVVAGFTSLAGDSRFEQTQALDWFVLTSVAGATARLGFPVTAIGTNLSVRRQAYDSVGGYRKIPFSVTEDYALFHAVTSSENWLARFSMDPNTLVRSAACGTLRQLFSQKKRWFTGGRRMDAKSLFIFSFPYMFNVLILVGAFVSPLWALGIALAVKLIADFLLCLPSLIRFRRLSLVSVYPLFEVYYYTYVLLFPPLVLFGGEITWKETKFRG